MMSVLITQAVQTRTQRVNDKKINLTILDARGSEIEKSER